jgi:hypothetical protein
VRNVYLSTGVSLTIRGRFSHIAYTFNPSSQSLDSSVNSKSKDQSSLCEGDLRVRAILFGLELSLWGVDDDGLCNNHPHLNTRQILDNTVARSGRERHVRLTLVGLEFIEAVGEVALGQELIGSGEEG